MELLIWAKQRYASLLVVAICSWGPWAVVTHTNLTPEAELPASVLQAVPAEAAWRP